jgi:hypothetical protein
LRRNLKSELLEARKTNKSDTKKAVKKEATEKQNNFLIIKTLKCFYYKKNWYSLIPELYYIFVKDRYKGTKTKNKINQKWSSNLAYQSLIAQMEMSRLT